MVTRDIVSRPCADACATITTDRRVEGAPVYRCPGCDSEWIELSERTTPAPQDTAAVASTGTDEQHTATDQDHQAPATPTAAPPAGGADPSGIIYPRLVQTVLDARDVRPLAEFYKALLGLLYRPGDAPHFSGSDEPDWLVLTHHDGTPALAFQGNDRHQPPTWPNPGVPQQMHVDMTVPDRAALAAVRARAEALGATLLADRTDDVVEPLYVFADPAGHPFCVFVG